jgi:hypothetical protein
MQVRKYGTTLMYATQPSKGGCYLASCLVKAYEAFGHVLLDPATSKLGGIFAILFGMIPA